MLYFLIYSGSNFKKYIKAVVVNKVYQSEIQSILQLL
jgi:hypothetical protein